MSGFRRFASAALILVLPLLPGCGGGAGSVKPAQTSTSSGSFSLAVPSVSLPVPPVANQSSGPYPYAGTTQVTLTRIGSFTGAVNLSVLASSLPAGVKATFDDASLAASSTTATLSIQAGYPTSQTFTSYTYPAQGTYSITIQGVDPSDSTRTASATFSLRLYQEPADFAMAFTNASGTTADPATSTNIDLLAGATEVRHLLVYWAQGTYASPYGPVSLAVVDKPSSWNITLDAAATTLNDVRTLSIYAPAGLAAGTYTFRVSASYLGVTHVLPVVVTYSPAPFYLQPPAAAQVTVAAGQSLAFPMYLWHDDDYFGTTEPADGTDPVYVGSTQLSVGAGLPSGLSVAFGNTNPTALAASPLVISADSATIPGTYPVTLNATRVGISGLTTVSSRNLDVVVSPASSSATLWFQNAEWGQTVLAPNLKLVAGKPALLRAHLLADRAGVAAPVITAAVYNRSNGLVDTLTLSGPAIVPTGVVEGDLPSTGTSFPTSYTAILPAADVAQGMSVVLQATGAAGLALTPAVDAGMTLGLTAVPIICSGNIPTLPSDATLNDELLAYWPFKAVSITRRASYTTSTVIPQPSNATGMAYGWEQLLSELAALRTVDGSANDYFGFFNPGLQFPVSGTIVGLSYLGDGAGIGIDQTCATQMLANGFANSDDPHDLATMVMVHEMGHAFDLNHAPAGGAGSPQLDYPYYGAGIGTWGYDPAAQVAYAPTANYDVMSYSDTRHWLSDWDYISAMAFLEAHSGVAGSLIPATSRVRPQSEQWVVSGWIGADDQPHLAPLVRTTCAASAPVAGSHSLVLETAGGSRSISFSAVQIPDLPSGHRYFAFTVPAGDELTGAEVQVDGASTRGAATGRTLQASTPHVSRRLRTGALAARAQAVAEAAAAGSLVIQPNGSLLHLEWDASVHPYVNVFHEGDSRTTLALHLTGGSADLPVGDLPAGGKFVVQYSDGLNPVVRSVGR